MVPTAALESGAILNEGADHGSERWNNLAYG